MRLHRPNKDPARTTIVVVIIVALLIAWFLTRIQDLWETL